MSEKYKVVLKIESIIMIVLAVAMLPSLIIGIYDNENIGATSFMLVIILLLVIGFIASTPFFKIIFYIFYL